MQVHNVWHDNLKRFYDAKELWALILSQNLCRIRGELIANVSLVPNIHEKGSWIMMASLNHFGLVFQVHEVIDSGFSTPVYSHVDNIERLALAHDELVILSQSHYFTTTRVPLKGDKGEVSDADCRKLISFGRNFWTVGDGMDQNLDFDPKDWKWLKIGMIKSINCFGYTTKKGCRIIYSEGYVFSNSVC